MFIHQVNFLSYFEWEANPCTDLIPHALTTTLYGP